MIIRRIPLPKQNKLRTFRRLMKYVRQPTKVAWIIASGRLPHPEYAEWLMTGTAAANPRVTKPAVHLVLGWSPDERPTLDQMQVSVHTALHAAGLFDHEWIAAAHHDALHPHVHVVANRVHPVTFRPNDDSWSRLRLFNAARELNERFGWRSFPSQTDVVQINGTRFERWEVQPSSLRGSTGDMLVPTFQEWLARDIRPLLLGVVSRNDATWRDVHGLLAEHGVRYQPTGRGAVVFDVDEPRFRARASHLGRFASLARLEMRLGPYVDLPSEIEIDRSRSYRNAIRRGPDRRPPALRARYRADVADMLAARDVRRPIERWSDQRASERERRAQLRAVQRTRRAAIEDVPARERWAACLLAQIQSSIERDELRATVAKERRDLSRELFATQRLPSWRSWMVTQVKNNDQQALAYLATMRRERSLGRLWEQLVPSQAPRTRLSR